MAKTEQADKKELGDLGAGSNWAMLYLQQVASESGPGDDDGDVDPENPDAE